MDPGRLWSWSRFYLHDSATFDEEPFMSASQLSSWYLWIRMSRSHGVLKPKGCTKRDCRSVALAAAGCRVPDTVQEKNRTQTQQPSSCTASDDFDETGVTASKGRAGAASLCWSVASRDLSLVTPKRLVDFISNVSLYVIRLSFMYISDSWDRIQVKTTVTCSSHLSSFSPNFHPRSPATHHTKLGSLLSRVPWLKFQQIVSELEEQVPFTSAYGTTKIPTWWDKQCWIPQFIVPRRC